MFLFYGYNNRINNVKEIYVKYVINIFYNFNEFFEIYIWLIIVRCN